ncbi:MAG: flagellar export chaperone FliS [Planctomycetota bacterium]
MPPKPAVNPYLRTQIMTAAPEELRLMLFDGAVKFCKQARHAFDAGDFHASYEALAKAKKVVLELSVGMDRKQAPDVAEKMGALYTFIYRKLVDANMDRSAGPLDEATRLLEYERDTWRMLIEKTRQSANLNAEATQAAVPTQPTPSADPAASDPARRTAISAYARSA